MTSRNSNPSFESHDPVQHRRTTAARILVLVSHSEHRQQIVELLGDRYDVVTTDDPHEPLCEGLFDLCLVDTSGLDDYRDLQRTCVETGEDGFLPSLLVHTRERPLPNPENVPDVDDVVVTPLNGRELAWRVESLLGWRECSLALAQAQTELAEKRTQLEQLLDAAAHDLRNPLQLLKLHVEQHDDRDDSSLRNAVLRMEHLVRDLLTLHQTEPDYPHPAPQPVEVRPLVESCWDRVPTKGATLEIDIEEDVWIRAVPHHLGQLVVNLLSNAVEHGGEGVTVRVGALDDTSGLYVADDGPGIPEAEREAVFENGYSTGAGNGLGLGLVSRVAGIHGWEVRLTEDSGGGTRVELQNLTGEKFQ